MKFYLPQKKYMITNKGKVFYILNKELEFKEIKTPNGHIIWNDREGNIKPFYDIIIDNEVVCNTENDNPRFYNEFIDSLRNNDIVYFRHVPNMGYEVRKVCDGHYMLVSRYEDVKGDDGNMHHYPVFEDLPIKMYSSIIRIVRFFYPKQLNGKGITKYYIKNYAGNWIEE